MRRRMLHPSARTSQKSPDSPSPPCRPPKSSPYWHVRRTFWAFFSPRASLWWSRDIGWRALPLPNIRRICRSWRWKCSCRSGMGRYSLLISERSKEILNRLSLLLGKDTGTGVDIQRHLELPVRLVPIAFRQTALGRSINPIKIIYIPANLYSHSLAGPLRVIIAIHLHQRSFRDGL